jgi:hypothetical protein
MTVKIKESKGMSVLEAVEDLRQQIERLSKAQISIANALALIQKNQKLLADDLEIARTNLETLQNCYLKKSAIPIGN